MKDDCSAVSVEQDAFVAFCPPLFCPEWTQKWAPLALSSLYEPNDGGQRRSAKFANEGEQEVGDMRQQTQSTIKRLLKDLACVVDDSTSGKDLDASPNNLPQTDFKPAT